MNASSVTVRLFIVALLGLACPALAQNGEKGRRRAEAQRPVVRLPDDKRLLSLHLDFVKKAEKLAAEYEGQKDWGKARSVYEEILKLVPQYPPAQARLADMLRRESEAKQVVVTVKANEGWQDTGVVLLPGKPVSLQSSGTWVFNLKVETNAEGLTIPKELRDFNPGCLIGMVVSGRDDEENRPFIVGSGKQMMPERGGRLFLRMYDTVPADNAGSLKVDIRGTFQEVK